MYHRIATLPHDPWSLAVEPRNFADHLAILKKRRTVVTVSELVARHRAGSSTRKLAAISFDDGYIDVLTDARPILVAAACPATIFIPTKLVGARERFWWDTLAHVFLEMPSLPDMLTMTIAGETHSWRLADMAGDGEDSRRKTLDDVWARLLPLEHEARGELVAQVAEWAGASVEASQTERCMTQEELAKLWEPGFVDLGAHSRRHPSLPTLSPTALAEEVTGSVEDLRNFLGQEPAGFGYPYGHFSPECEQAVRQSGVAFACTTRNDAIRSGDDVFALPRLTAFNMEASEFERAFG
jgi:peptidoglycan/xylan/chitin deacetylase (PgdA/CDA1 family)